MARLVFHEHPTQRGECLPGAFASYVQRIPVDGFTDLDSVWLTIQSRPFEVDTGEVTPEAAADADPRCCPIQRSRVWPAAMNCWEQSAHFVAAAQVFLGDEWIVHVYDRDILVRGRRMRHVWPSLQSPRGDHFLVDLRNLPLEGYEGRIYTGVIMPANGDAWPEQLLQGVELGDGMLLQVYQIKGARKAPQRQVQAVGPRRTIPASSPSRAPQASTATAEVIGKSIGAVGGIIGSLAPAFQEGARAPAPDDIYGTAPGGQQGAHSPAPESADADFAGDQDFGGSYEDGDGFPSGMEELPAPPEVSDLDGGLSQEFDSGGEDDFAGVADFDDAGFADGDFSGGSDFAGTGEA